jgi:23S rRNA A2030 N6-methylase RlmJ
MGKLYDYCVSELLKSELKSWAAEGTNFHYVLTHIGANLNHASLLAERKANRKETNEAIEGFMGVTKILRCLEKYITAVNQNPGQEFQEWENNPRSHMQIYEKIVGEKYTPLTN